MRNKILSTVVLTLTGLLAMNAGNAPAADDSDLSSQTTGTPAAPRLSAPLGGANGRIQVVVTLADAPLAVACGPNAKKLGSRLTPVYQRSYVRSLNQKHDALMTQVRNLGGRELGRVSKALNAVIVQVDASKLEALAKLPNVISVRPIMNYEMNLSDTVPYIGAAAVQTAGIDGRSVRVAVLDSGVDYTHRNFGGPGTEAAYLAAYGDGSTNDLRHSTRDGLFPTAKVIGGFDFVGEQWPDADLAPDPDPIDFQGHGTHVADIIAGHSLDGTHKGVAPRASLVVCKVCSSIATACSGVALLEAMDFILDPTGDGTINDAVDVVNMSLGSNYGQKQDDLSAATANVVRLGVVVVCAAGNAADHPYIVSSPSTTPEAISVAESQVPSAKVFPLIINSPANIAGQYNNTATVDWAPIGAGFTGDVVYVGRGCAGDAYITTNVAGKVVLIDRGVCGVSLKVDRAAKLGAKAVLIGLVAAGDPFAFAFGGGDTFVPTLVITKATADLIKANLSAPVNVTVSPTTAISLVGSTVSTSARGPTYSDSSIKPDVCAPGASVSAEVGTGTGETAFGGTSGATPMVSGSAALLIQAYPQRSPAEIKSVLMNTAETDIKINPALFPGVLAPITRIGGGEVRINRAVASTTAAMDAEAETGSLSFGYQALSGAANSARIVRVINYSNSKRTYTVATHFRYADDAAGGAVSLSAPDQITVPPRSSATFQVKLAVDPSKLPNWTLNGGSQGGNGALLTSHEFDGYIDIADARDSVHLAWQVLPHKAAEVRAIGQTVALNKQGVGTLQLDNRAGAAAGRVEIFSLTGSSRKIPKPNLPQPGDNFAVIDLINVGARIVSLGADRFGIQFAIHTKGERAHPNYPAEFDIYIDNNRDGTNDFAIFNSENGGFGASGQNAVSVFNLATGSATTVSFADADLNSGNIIMTVPLSALGLTPDTKFDFFVLAFDNYFTGNLTDAIFDMTYTAGKPRFVGGGIPATGVPAGGSSTLVVESAAGGDAASPSQTGLLLLYRDAKPGTEAETINVVH